MKYENVKLWFARDVNEEIITIDDINKENRNNTYFCPVCGSCLKPKAIKSSQITSHFAHVDASKCSSESMIHWWFKNKFLDMGDEFMVENKKFTCKGIQVEKSYETYLGTYKPDVTILTECGNSIYFEMNYSNSKKISEYLDIWLELGNMVVEVDIKKIMNLDSIHSFKALFYNGKCFNTKKMDTYYNTIGKYKEETFSKKNSQDMQDRIRKLDWFWRDVLKYKNNEINIEDIAVLINTIDSREKFIVDDILRRSMCNTLYADYKNYMSLDELVHFTNESEGLRATSGLHETIRMQMNQLNNKIEVKIISKNCEKSESYYNGSRKHPYRYRNVFSHCECYITIKYDNKLLRKIGVTNRMLQFSDSQLLKYLLELKKEIMNIQIKRNCKDCEKGFYLKISEINYYTDKGLHIPKRCKQCRAVNKGGINIDQQTVLYNEIQIIETEGI